jgi:hypothetical protein
MIMSVSDGGSPFAAQQNAAHIRAEWHLDGDGA